MLLVCLSAGLGWLLTQQSKRKWIVALFKRNGWLDKNRHPHIQSWIARQVSVKFSEGYDFEVSAAPNKPGSSLELTVSAGISGRMERMGAVSALRGRDTAQRLSRICILWHLIHQRTELGR